MEGLHKKNCHSYMVIAVCFTVIWRIFVHFEAHCETDFKYKVFDREGEHSIILHPPFREMFLMFQTFEAFYYAFL